MVSIDLKFHTHRSKNYIFIVFVDIATRYCSAKVISNKKPETIISAFFSKWICIFGSPRKVLTDNGREFHNLQFRQLSETFNFKVYTTAAESPWSNGIIERLNGILGLSVGKIMEDEQCTVHIAIAWAISARNACDINKGHSPNALVFSFNTAVPTAFNSTPSGLEEVTGSDIVRKNLNAMYKGRIDFWLKQSDAQLKKALNSQTRQLDGDDINIGDEVYYKRQNCKIWRGPGTVEAYKGKIVLVKHGGEYVKVHTVSIRKAPRETGLQDLKELFGAECPENSTNDEVSIGSHLRSAQKRHISEVGFDESHVNKKQRAEQHKLSKDSLDAEEEINNEKSSQEEELSKDSMEAEGTINNEESSGEEQSMLVNIQQNVKCNLVTQNKGSEKCLKTWQPGMRFHGYSQVDGLYISGVIKDWAGKPAGRNRHCYNVCLDQGDKNGNPQEWIDLSTVDNLSVLDDHESEILIMYSNDEIREAKMKEIAQWEENNVMVKVPNEGQEAISTRWVMTKKEVNPQTYIVKARLVARGFEEDTSNLKKDSPTCSKENLRILLAIAAAKGWQCKSIDVRSAYLQGDEINRRIFVKPPKDFDQGELWLLKKTIYGLCDAARAWYETVKNTLVNLGMKTNYLWGRSLFYWKKEGILQGLLAVHVDDFIYAGGESFGTQIMKRFSESFRIGNIESKSFTYLGIKINSFSDGITIDQIQYTKSLDHMEEEKGKTTNNSLCNEENNQVKAKIGQLNWLSTHTRPDIAFEVSDLGSSISNPNYKHIRRINKVIDIVIKEPLQIFFPKLDDSENWDIVCYADAALVVKEAYLSNGKKDERSQGAHIIFLEDKKGNRCTLDWRSKRIDTVVRSALAAEILAMVEASENALYIADILKIILGEKAIRKVRCFTDSKSLVDNLRSTHQIENRFQRKHMAILQQRVDEKVCSIDFVEGKYQLADALTKRGVLTRNLRNAISRVKKTNE